MRHLNYRKTLHAVLNEYLKQFLTSNQTNRQEKEQIALGTTGEVRAN